MMIRNLFAVVAVMAGALAMPVDRVHALEKRAVPRLGGVNLAVGLSYPSLFSAH